MYKSTSPLARMSLRSILIVISSMTVAFLVGIETAGEVHPVVTGMLAGGVTVEGDLNGNGSLDLQDVRIALELAQGYRTPTPAELSADPNRDFRFTVDDAIAIIDKLQQQPMKTNVEP